MLDVHLPLADGRELGLPRYTKPEPEQGLVLENWVGSCRPNYCDGFARRKCHRR